MKKFIFALTAIFAASSVLAFEPDPITPFGSGTQTDPYLIESIYNLIWVDGKDAWFKQTQNIDASETTNWYDGAGFKPLLMYGCYDGNGYTIDNLYINRPDEKNIGLFSILDKLYASRFPDQDIAIKNLTLINCSISGSNCVGGIVGRVGKYQYDFNQYIGMSQYKYQQRSFSVRNCYIEGIINGYDYVGGITGGSSEESPYTCVSMNRELTFFQSFYNPLNHLYFKGLIDGNSRVGGIIGNGGCMESAARANIKGNSLVGGISGKLRCVAATPAYSGGTDSYFYKQFTFYSAVISNSYFNGNLIGGSQVGGLAGGASPIDLYGQKWANDGESRTPYDSAGIIDSFFDGLISSDGETGNILGYYDPFVGYNSPRYYYSSPHISDSYYNSDISSITNELYGIPLSDELMGNKNSYDFDFTNIWSYDENAKRPKLLYMKDLLVASDKGDIKVYPKKDFYFSGDKVNLEAIPWPGHKFDYFVINETNIYDAVYNYVIGETNAVTAVFSPNENYELSFDINGCGFVEVTPEKENYNWGDEIIISAFPSNGYHFSCYQFDDLVITNQIAKFTITGNAIVEVDFLINEYTITKREQGPGSLIISPLKEKYNHGDEVNLTNVPETGYHFNYMVINGQTNYNDVADLVITNDLSITSYFSIDEYILNAWANYGGNIKVHPELNVYPYGTEIIVTAIPLQGFEFKNFTGTYTNTVSVIKFNIVGDTQLAANFTASHYRINVQDSDNGKIVVSPVKEYYNFNDEIIFTAVPDNGYIFKQFTYNETVYTENNLKVAVTEDINISAAFEPDEYTIVINDSTGGSLEISPRKDAYDYNEVITLTATPSAGYELKRVYNDSFSSTNLVSQYTVKGTTSFTAEFIQRNYRCIVTPSGGGSVTVTPAQGVYHYGDVITITATPDTGYAFKQYSGSISDSNKVCVVTIQDHLNITAEFELASYTVTLNGSTGGTLSVSPVKDKYKYNEEITLTAAPSEGYELRKVYNDTYSSTNRVSKYIVKGDTWFTPDFVQREYRCIVTTSEGGTVSVTPSKTTYHYGDVITLTAVPETGYAFKEYSGSVTGEDKVCVVTVKDHLNVNAEFYFDAYELIAKATEGGSVTVDPEKETYHANEIVKVSATPVEGFSFAGFAGTVESKDNPLEVLMNQHHDITAVFTNVEYKVVVAVSEGGKLSIEPSQDYYHFNDELSFSVETDPGWHLEEILGYYESITNTTGTLMVKSDLTLTPVFVLNEYKVSVDVVYGGEVTLSPYKNTYHYNDAIKIICKPYDSYALERLVINGTDTEEYEFILTDDTEILAVFGYEPVKPEGTGSKDDPYQIATVANLFWLSRNSYMSPDTYSVLTSDLDISICKDWQNGKGFEPIGTLEHPYGGTFDGQGFSISGLYIDDDEAVNAGLFGYAKDAEITDLNIFDAAVRGKENCGGLVGYCYNCSIDNVYVNAQVYADINAGGLVGSANYATIQRSSSEKTVSGNENLGGILGKGTDCTVANCFTTAKMNGYDSIGGIIGSSIFSTVSYCYAAGGITANTTQGGIVGASQDSTVVSSFFDKTQARENGYGTGVTAQELYSRATFSDWDFINIWEQYDGITRPFLRGGEDSNWQKLAGASTGKISISGVLSGDDLETIKANKTVCVYSLMDNTLLADPVQLSGTSLKTKEVKVQYNAKKRSLKYSSTVPQLTVGAFNDEGVLQCQLNSSKKKLDYSLVFDNDITDTIGNSQVSLCDDFMNNGCLTGTKIQLTDKGKSLTYKGTVNDVTLQVNIALKTGKVSIKYSSKNKVSAVVSK